MIVISDDDEDNFVGSISFGFDCYDIEEYSVLSEYVDYNVIDLEDGFMFHG